MGNTKKTRKSANDGFSSPAASKSSGKSGKKTVISVICMALVLALCVGVIVYTKVADSGFFYRNTVSISSENFEVNNAMLSYFFNSQYQQMSSSLEQMGADVEKNLKDQMYSGSNSYFDLIMQSYTIPRVKQILVLCEAAKAEGFELDEHNREHIEEAISSIEAMAETYAKQSGVSKNYYLRATYGYGITIDDIRDAIELNQLAAAYSEHIVDSYQYTEAEWDAYLDENRSDFLVADYVSYTFDSDDFEVEESDETEVASSASNSDETEAETTAEVEEEEARSEAEEAAYSAAQSLAQRLMAAESGQLEIFNSTVKTHLENVVYADVEDETDKTESVEADLKATVAEAVENDQTNEFLKYLFGENLNEDVYVVDNDSNGTYTVYYITKAPYIEEYVTKNVRVIALSVASNDNVEELRDSILEEFESGEKTEDAFAKLAETYSDDSNASENSGLYENQGKNDLDNEELSAWLYSDEREIGDYTYATNDEGTDDEVIYIVYYTGDGILKWQRDVDNTMVDEACEEKYEEFAETYEVEVDLAEAYKIPSQAGL